MNVVRNCPCSEALAPSFARVERNLKVKPILEAEVNRLNALVRDQNDGPIEAAVTWASSDPAAAIGSGALGDWLRPPIPRRSPPG